MKTEVERLEERAREIGVAVKDCLPKGWGMLLVLYDYDESGCTTFISTGSRSTSIELLEKVLKKLKQESFVRC